MTVIELQSDASFDVRAAREDERLHRRLRVAGVAAILLAALGSVWSHSTLVGGAVGDGDCVMRVADAAGFSSGCDAPASADTAH